MSNCFDCIEFPNCLEAQMGTAYSQVCEGTLPEKEDAEETFT